MNTCGTCKYFGSKDDRDAMDYHRPDGYKFCSLIKQRDYLDRDPDLTALAVTVDASGCFAALCVKDDFGCNQWESEGIAVKLVEPVTGKPWPDRDPPHTWPPEKK